jgi:hypothetical protein
MVRYTARYTAGYRVRYTARHTAGYRVRCTVGFKACSVLAEADPHSMTATERWTSLAGDNAFVTACCCYSNYKAIESVKSTEGVTSCNAPRQLSLYFQFVNANFRHFHNSKRTGGADEQEAYGIKYPHSQSNGFRLTICRNYYIHRLRDVNIM